MILMVRKMSYRNLKDDPNAYFEFIKEMSNVVDYGTRAAKLELIAELLQWEQEDLLEEMQYRMGIDEYYRIIPLC
jgi:hypothetical protein